MTENVFAKVLEAVPEINNESEHEYKGPDGLRWCSICHTPKQTRTNIPEIGVSGVVNCVCKCQQQKKAEEQRREEARQKMEMLKDYGLKDNQYRNSSFAMDDRHDPGASDICRKYVEKWDEIRKANVGLLLHGEVGGGKTFLAACMANALIEKGVAVLMTNMPTLAHKMTANFGDERQSVLRTIQSIPLLIIDDFGMERSTATSLENSYEIINTRYKAQKPLIVTTNLTMDAIKDAKSVEYKRLYSRLGEMCPKPVKVTTGRRNNEARKKLEELNRIMQD